MTLYNVNTPAYKAYTQENVIARINHKYLAQECAKNGVTRYICKDSKYDYILKKNGNTLGFIRTYPSNNLKFYAGRVGGGELFHTFAKALAHVMASNV